MIRRVGSLACGAILVGGAVLTSGVPAIARPASPSPRTLPPLAPLPRLDARSPSLSSGGQQLLKQADLVDAPRYSVSARVDPRTGEVDGRYRARLARPRDGELRLRMLAGLPALRAGLEVHDVTANGKPAAVRRDEALLVLSTGRGSSATVDVRLRFSYRVPRGNSTVGRFLAQATIGLLTRHRNVLLLGHWFPLWLPPGAEVDPELSGFGDIGNFAAGAITARVEVPAGYDVYGAGTTVDDRVDDGTRTLTESGMGLRDLSLVVARGMHSAEVRVGDVTVRATAPQDVDVHRAAAEAAADLDALQRAFGPYPWSELEEVNVPLGPQVGGMEWPGAIWIDGPGAGTAGGVDLTVVHELAHQWWHALVGNDSIAAPVVDEPLAQYAMCVVAEARGGGREPCGFGGHVLAPAATPACLDRRTDEFAPGEYGDLIYGEAPAFYVELSQLIGTDATVTTLRAIAERHAFGTLTAPQLREELAGAVPERSPEVLALWDEVIGPPGCRAAS